MTTMNARRRVRVAPLYSQGGPRLPARIVALFDAFSSSDRRAGLFLTLLCLVALLPGFFSISVVDRDEARFAQISRQMLETGNLAEIRIGWEGQHTHPFGLHWIQAAVVGTAGLVGVPQAESTIWLYRLPSLAGAIAAVLLTFWAGLAFMRRRAAMLAAALLATSVALGVAGRLAVPETMLLACVAAMMGATGRFYLAARHGGAQAGDGLPVHSAGLAAIFWGSLAFALLVSGLMAPLYAGLPLLCLVLLERSARFLRGIRPLAGLLVLLLIGGLWFYLRHYPPMETQADMLARSLLGRVAPAFQGFGGPPGTYFLLFWGMFWPAAPLAALAVPIIWKARRLRAVSFLLCWVLPVWILLEILPTKVPAYILPTLPAIAILIAMAIERGAMALRVTRLAQLLWLWPLIGAVIAVAALSGLAVFDRTTSLLAWPLLILGFFALVTAAGSVREYGVEKSVLFALVGMLVSGAGVMQLVLPHMQSFWISPRLVAMAEQEPCAARSEGIRVGTAGYNEPSLVFLLPQPPRFVDGAGAADFLNGGGCRVVFVEARQEARFARRAEALGLRIVRGQEVWGFDYNNLRRMQITLYRRAF